MIGMGDYRISFVLPSGCKEQSEASEIMLQAYETCRRTVENAVWVSQEDLGSINFDKKDFVIFESFEGEHFEKLSEAKCARVLGPWAVSVCLVEGKRIPNFPCPIYNVAMFGCIVTCSQLPNSVKNDIKEKVQLMGGYYTDTLVLKNTHLVTDSCKSQKYLLAAERGIKLMLPDWVSVVWDASQNSNVHADDTKFSNYRCLPFHNLTMSSTGIKSDDEKNHLTELVSQNGGTLTGRLNLKATDILICHGPAGSTSEKYKAARKSSKVKCVTLNWVYDSIEKGYALCPEQYPVRKSTSTPTKEGENINPDFSIMSAIGGPNFSQKVTFEETGNVSTASNINFEPPRSFNVTRSKRKASKQLLDTIDLKKVKKAGQFLDGCSVYVAGFDAEYREKLCKILNLTGATRYDSVSERVTHVIVGDPACQEIKLIRSNAYPCVLVCLQWLLDSLEQQKPLKEENYLLTSSDFERSDIGSPLSKKGLNLLKSSKTLTEGEVDSTVISENNQQVSEQEDDNIMKRYLTSTNITKYNDTLDGLLKDAVKLPEFTEDALQNHQEEHLTKPNETSTQMTDTCSVTEDESIQPIFEGLKFHLSGFDEHYYNFLENIIDNGNGIVVTNIFEGHPDYEVVPVFNPKELQHKALRIVNDVWVTESCQKSELQDLQYYHHPFILNEAKPLKDSVVTLSSYTSYERDFLKSLIQALGGISQDQFARKSAPEKGIVASTHLLSFEPSGKKYEAALKWNLPVVNKDWLLDCARTGLFLPEKDYLIGDSKVPQTKNSLSSVDATPVFKNPKAQSPVPVLKVDEDSSLRVLTPVKLDFNTSTTEKKTPVNQIYKFYPKDTPDGCSQVTPVNKIIQEARENNLLGTPESPKTYYPWDPKTPDTPLGAFIRPNPSPNLRKEMQRYINNFPDFEPPKRRLSTPLSEIKKKMWNKILKKDEETSINDLNLNPLESQRAEENSADEEMQGKPDLPGEKKAENTLINNKLQQLEDMLSASGGASARRASRNFQPSMPPPAASSEVLSQKFTVGWDYRENENEAQVAPETVKVFMISGTDSDLRQTFATQIESLGGIVSDLSNYDPSCTHLVCPKPARNEKILSCMAAGKWILHTSYIEKSVEAGNFLDEEEFEFGNPKSSGKLNIKCDRETESRMESIYWWRKEISRRGYGAFNDMKAVIVANKTDPIIRVIEAGGGIVINVSPPFEYVVHATHCLMEPKSVKNFADYIPLAKQGIYCVNTLYISDFLHRVSKDIRDCILPQFLKYYDKN